MANLRIKCGAAEMIASGSEKFIRQESSAFIECITRKIGEEVIAVQSRIYGKSSRREARQTVAAEKTEAESPFSIVRRSRSAASLAEIKATIASGRGPEVIRPFDELEFKLDTGETVTAVCGGYVTPTRARFVFKDALGDAPMNDDATNAGGYYKSKGRRHVLENIYPHLPPELREIITPRLFVETIDGERVEYADSLWIPSGTDVFGPREDWYKEEPDSVQLEIFKTERGRVKERNGETVYWWLRSPYRSNSPSFVSVHAGGTVNYYSALYSLAFAPGFDL